jgi:hypothetical protein
VHLGIRYDDLKERVGAALNLVPEPLGLAMFAMQVARSLEVAQSTDMITELARDPVGAAELARRLGLRVGLFFHLTWSADTYWLRDSGFGTQGAPPAPAAGSCPAAR